MPWGNPEDSGPSINPERMNKSCFTVLLALVSSVAFGADEPGFRSKLFKQGKLVYADEFDETLVRGRYGPNKKNITVAEGKLQVLPISDGTINTVVHIYRIPKKFVCHLRYKVNSKDPDAGVGLQIGGHKMHLGKQKGEEGNVSLFSRVGKKTFILPEVKGFAANEWIDMIIEYEEGRILLNINGSEKIFEDAAVSMDGASSLVFKKNSDSLLFDHVRLWEATE